MLYRSRSDTASRKVATLSVRRPQRRRTEPKSHRVWARKLSRHIGPRLGDSWAMFTISRDAAMARSYCPTAGYSSERRKSTFQRLLRALLFLGWAAMLASTMRSAFSEDAMAEGMSPRFSYSIDKSLAATANALWLLKSAFTATLPS